MTDRITRSRAAIDRAFREESGLVLRWLTAKLGNRDDAQDVLQSVYARALDFARTNEIENAKALIFRMAARLAIDELRRRRRFIANHMASAGEDPEGLLLSVISDTPTSEQTLISREDLAIAMKALGKLSNKARTALLMNRVYGATYPEIAEALGVSVSSVEKYIIKALVILRDIKRQDESKRSQAASAKIQPTPQGFLAFAAGKRR